MPTFVVPSSYGTLREFNTCHAPGGAATGGQFCTKDEATGPYPDQEDRGGWERWWKTEREWKERMTHAVSLGKIEPADAQQLGWRPENSENKFTALPAVLYHVSTGYNEILRSGLKTRKEIGGEHRGLGGGSDETISFTDDLKTARTIRSAVLEARRVVRGEVSPQTMVRMLKAQPTLDRAETGRAKYMQSQGPVSAYETFVGFYAGKTWRKGDPLPRNLKTVLKGVKVDDVSRDSHDPVIKALADQHGSAGIPVTSLPKGYTAFGSWEGRDQRYTRQIVRKMLPAEKQDAAFEMYKRFAMAREYAGGRMDPMFFMTDAAALSKVKVRDIKIMKFTPRKGAKGYKVSALGEWRVHTGKTVRYAGIEESA